MIRGGLLSQILSKNMFLSKKSLKKAFLGGHRFVVTSLWGLLVAKPDIWSFSGVPMKTLGRFILAMWGVGGTKSDFTAGRYFFMLNLEDFGRYVFCYTENGYVFFFLENRINFGRP